MYPPKARRITPFVTIPAGMARHFFRIFWGSNPVEAAVPGALGLDLQATRLPRQL
jgi:hypothetical protein